MLAVRRATIARETTVVGRGLHEGRETTLQLRPAAAGAGIFFVRTDLGPNAVVPAKIENRVEAPRRTLLRCGAAEVHTVEHLLAAVCAFEITDLEICIDNAEVPGMDGSAAPFLAALADAGRKELAGDVKRLRLDRVVAVEGEGGARIVAHPQPGALRLGYRLALPGDLGEQRVEYELERERFAAEIAPARTFCLAREAMMLKAAGLGKGADTSNTLVIGEDGEPIDNALRYPDEYARHKVLDLFGDLALLGAGLEARVLSYKGGHALNAKLCAALHALLDESGRESAQATESTGSHRPSLIDPASIVRAPGRVEARFVPSDTAFRGHFPGAPVLPGVVSLAALIELAQRLETGRRARVRVVRNSHFRQVIRPGEVLRARCERVAGDRVVCVLFVGEQRDSVREAAVQVELELDFGSQPHTGVG